MVTKKTVQVPKYEDVKQQVGTIDVEMYVTSDGREFYDLRQAGEHEWNVKVNMQYADFPYGARVFNIESLDEFLNFEKDHIRRYGTKLMYDTYKFTFPNRFAFYVDHSEDDEYYEQAYVLTYEEFSNKVKEELERLK